VELSEVVNKQLVFVMSFVRFRHAEERGRMNGAHHPFRLGMSKKETTLFSDAKLRSDEGLSRGSAEGHYDLRPN
jgi:aspartyl-tRNA synthetase